MTDRTSHTSNTTSQYHIYHQLRSLQRELEYYKGYYQNDVKLKKMGREGQLGQEGEEIVQMFFEFREGFVELSRKRQMEKQSGQERQEYEGEIKALFRVFRKELSEKLRQKQQHHLSNQQSTSSSNFQQKYLQLTQQLYEKIARIQQLQRQLQDSSKNHSSSSWNSNSSSNSNINKNGNSSNQNNNSNSNNQTSGKQNLNPNIFIQPPQTERFKKMDLLCFQASINVQQFEYKPNSLSICTQTLPYFSLFQSTIPTNTNTILKRYKQIFKNYISACNLVWKLCYKYVKMEMKVDVMRQYQWKNNQLLFWFSGVKEKGKIISWEKLEEYIQNCNGRVRYLQQFVQGIGGVIEYKKERVVGRIY